MTNDRYDQPNIAIIGAGVIGLTSAIELIQAGYKKLTVYAENITPYTTSDVAAAICGTQKFYPEFENTWYQNTLLKYEQLLSVKNSGISKLNYLEMKKKKSTPSDYICTSTKKVFLINSKINMPFLMELLNKNNITIKKEKIINIHELTKQYNIIINCAGLGARKIFLDENIFPVRGQIVIVSKPKNLNACMAVLVDELTYIIPRDKDCILGGTEEINNWNLEPDKTITYQIIERAQQLYPLLKNEKILDVKVGLRPSRHKIRVETEKLDDRLIIHNYGHGGEGYSFSWGCAKAVKDIINKEYT